MLASSSTRHAAAATVAAEIGGPAAARRGQEPKAPPSALRATSPAPQGKGIFKVFRNLGDVHTEYGRREKMTVSAILRSSGAARGNGNRLRRNRLRRNVDARTNRCSLPLRSGERWRAATNVDARTNRCSLPLRSGGRWRAATDGGASERSTDSSCADVESRGHVLPVFFRGNVRTIKVASRSAPFPPPGTFPRCAGEGKC